jgi:hypothetical protein
LFPDSPIRLQAPPQSLLGAVWEIVVRIHPRKLRVRTRSQSYLSAEEEVTELFAVVAPVSLVGAVIVAWTQLRRW